MEDNKDIKQVSIIILCCIALILLIFTVQNCIKIINSYKVFEQYEAQLKSLEYKEKQRIIEEAKKKQEKIPKLTEVRD